MESYVRPPLVPREPGSPTLALWRFRVLAGLLLLVLTVVVFVVFVKLSGITEQSDPGFGIGLGAATVTAPAGP